MTDLAAALHQIRQAPGHHVFLRAGRLECAGVVKRISLDQVVVSCDAGRQEITVMADSIDELTLR